MRLTHLLLPLLFATPALTQVNSGGANTATFLQADTTTAGNWKGLYGKLGNVIAQSSISTPSNVTFNTAGAINLSLLDIWATDPRALLKQTPSYSASERVESYFHTPTSMDFLLTSPRGTLYSVALYFCNYQHEARSESVEALDSDTGQVFDSRAVPNMDGGVYLVYNYSGNVTFRVTNNAPSGTPTAAVSGFFWGDPVAATPTPPPPPTPDTTPPVISPFMAMADTIYNPVNLIVSATDNVAVASVQFQVDGANYGPAVTTPTDGSHYQILWDNTNAPRGIHSFTAIATDTSGNTASVHYGVTLANLPPAPATNSATMIGIDTTTLGNWKGVYGRDGNVIPQHSVMVPPYATFNTGGNINLELADLWASDPRALLKETYAYSPTERIESSFYTPSSMDIRIGATDGKEHQVAFYFANYEPVESPVVRVVDPATGNTLTAETIFMLPCYVVYRHTGSVIFRIEAPATNGRASLNGIFWDPAGSPLPLGSVPINVSIVAPSPASQTVTISAVITKATLPATVQYAIDGVNLGGRVGAPYAVQWDTTTLPEGPHSITASVVDAAGNTALGVLAVYVKNVAPGPPPVITITSPVAGSTVSGMSLLGASITSVGLKNVSFQVDNGPILNPPPGGVQFGATWDSTGVADGVHTLLVTATDLNNQTTTASETFNVKNSGSAVFPFVDITAPAYGATVSGTVTATATLSGGLTSVGWLFDDATFPTGSFVSGTATSVTLDTTKISNGPHNLTAIGSNNGGTIISITSSLVVNNAPPPNSQVSFVRMDTTTKGNWKGVYGQDGNFIAEFSYAAPSYSTFQPVNTNRQLLDLWSTDPRAPLKPQGAYSDTERVKSEWSNPASMDFQVSATDGQQHRIALYFVDWQPGPGLNRRLRLTVLNTDTGEVLARNGLDTYTGGVYLVYDYRGNITFRVENMTNPLLPSGWLDAEVSAFFWGQ